MAGGSVERDLRADAPGISQGNGEGRTIRMRGRLGQGPLHPYLDVSVSLELVDQSFELFRLLQLLRELRPDVLEGVRPSLPDLPNPDDGEAGLASAVGA